MPRMENRRSIDVASMSSRGKLSSYARTRRGAQKTFAYASIRLPYRHHVQELLFVDDEWERKHTNKSFIIRDSFEYTNVGYTQKMHNKKLLTNFSVFFIYIEVYADNKHLNVNLIIHTTLAPFSAIPVQPRTSPPRTSTSRTMTLRNSCTVTSTAVAGWCRVVRGRSGTKMCSRVIGHNKGDRVRKMVVARRLRRRCQVTGCFGIQWDAYNMHIIYLCILGHNLYY